MSLFGEQVYLWSGRELLYATVHCRRTPCWKVEVETAGVWQLDACLDGKA